MALSGSLIERLSEHLSAHLGMPVDIGQGTAVGGGSINDVYRLETNEGRFFVKVNSADRFPSMFEGEADGLGRLHATGTIRVPQVIGTGEDHDETYLLLEHISAGPRRNSFWEDLGRSLAELHRHSNTRFGLEIDNYIGSLKQSNTTHDTWSEFFIHCRLEPQVKMARDRQRIGMGDALRFERLFGKLPSLFPSEPPALLHGDLWSGNFLTGPNGEPVLIDPAVYFGHREMDIAMSRLFGGFDPGFYSAYNIAWPMGAGWEERMDLCNLYPLLVHANLFGGGYAAQVHATLERFS
ncbi:MAG TPA: fructosamine kinase family protein [Flavobacteriales bacterium]|nr:fructosamine kinase family protein [Flavobacteriales bacterium]